MNHNTDCSESESVIVTRQYLSGIQTAGRRKCTSTDNRGDLATPDLYLSDSDSPSKSSNDRSRQGLQGFTQQSKHQIRDSLIVLIRDYGIDNLRWVVPTYNHASRETKERIAKNIGKLRKKLNYIINKTNLSYLAILGIQHCNTYADGFPCYDLNLVTPIKKSEKYYRK